MDYIDFSPWNMEYIRTTLILHERILQGLNSKDQKQFFFYISWTTTKKKFTGTKTKKVHITGTKKYLSLRLFIYFPIFMSDISAALGLSLETMSKEDLDGMKDAMHLILQGVSCNYQLLDCGLR